jgi:hypothetical protein
VYARQLNGGTLTLGVSGMLWERSLVMIDQETESLWSHQLGEAMQGPLEGETLEVIPSVMADWKVWKESHPNTTAVVLPRTANRFRHDLHREPQYLLIGLAVGGQSKGWDLRHLRDSHGFNDQVAERKVLVTHHEPSGTAAIYDRNLEGQELDFEFVDGGITDRQTGSSWDPLTGRALTSPMLGKRLVRLQGIISTHDAWHTFHPNTVLAGPESNDQPSGRTSK